MVVPCGDGNIKVCNLIEQAAMRYKKAIAKVGALLGELGRSRTALRCIHSTAPTWRCSPAAESGQATVRGLLSVREPAKTPPLSKGVHNSKISPRVETKVGPVCILCEE